MSWQQDCCIKKFKKLLELHLCPEDGEDEEEWKLRMTHAVGIDTDGISHHTLAQMKFWEHIEPGWHTNAASDIIQDLKQILLDSTPPEDLQKLEAIHIETSTCVSNVPPANPPFNFMISMKWWEETKHQYAGLVLHYFKGTKPKGKGWDVFLGTLIDQGVAEDSSGWDGDEDNDCGDDQDDDNLYADDLEAICQNYNGEDDDEGPIPSTPDARSVLGPW
ncbi:hypothetical protein NEOLEDRAFT_1180689 [Neolentinus lepideus HHB14362 ss-1]|uniref:Uncharacterized protein n=1 Tax=Neolentinus lepideus HHB14362 ss-1 TaxID=1314782 RepID=A0A165QRR4_9AGAM|nr:hypothetical protein NEOLEDRAFT_1180689 [Neolentinus lepideus HHB14362 ss-1]